MRWNLIPNPPKNLSFISWPTSPSSSPPDSCCSTSLTILLMLCPNRRRLLPEDTQRNIINRHYKYKDKWKYEYQDKYNTETRGWTNSCVLAEITGFSFLYQILSMQLALWNKTAISWWAEFMDDKVLACLSESHFKNFLLSEITSFLVFDLCETATGESVNGCRKAKVTHQKQRVQFKDQDFLGREFLYYWNHFLK